MRIAARPRSASGEVTEDDGACEAPCCARRDVRRRRLSEELRGRPRMRPRRAPPQGAWDMPVVRGTACTARRAKP